METRQHSQICLAQNFLRSPKLVRRLVGMSTIGPSDTVCEIGPGNGIITAALANVARQVVAIEKDPELVRRLRERFRPIDNVEIVEKDFLAYSFRHEPRSTRFLRTFRTTLRRKSYARSCMSSLI